MRNTNLWHSLSSYWTDNTRIISKCFLGESNPLSQPKGGRLAKQLLRWSLMAHFSSVTLLTVVSISKILLNFPVLFQTVPALALPSTTWCLKFSTTWCLKFSTTECLKFSTTWCLLHPMSQCLLHLMSQCLLHLVSQCPTLWCLKLHHLPWLNWSPRAHPTNPSV